MVISPFIRHFILCLFFCLSLGNTIAWGQRIQLKSLISNSTKVDSIRFFKDPVKGLVFSLQTSQGIEGVSVYEKHNIKATLTQIDGGFELYSKMGENHHDSIFFSKEGFADTCYLIGKLNQAEHRIYMRPLPEQVSSQHFIENAKNLDKLMAKLSEWHSNNPHYLNVKDTFVSVYAYALFPGISSNGKLDLLTQNNYSFNAIGQSWGVNKLEIGLIANLTLAHQNGLQIASILNLVEGNAFGTQIGGLANINMNSTRGLQLAGLYNHSKTLNGIQVSFGLNQCSSFSGLQVGLINLSDSAIGLPIGLLSYAKNGYHKKEISIDERAVFAFSYKTGKEVFYNIFQIGYARNVDRSIGLIGMGFGTQSIFEQKFKLAFEFTFSPLIPFGSELHSLNALGKVNISFVYPFKNGFELFAGPAVSVSAFNRTDPAFASHFRTFPLSNFYSSVDGNYSIKAWIGAKIGARLN